MNRGVRGTVKRRYVGLDIFRVVSVLAVCAFHTTIHLGCNYGILQPVSLMGAMFMTAFFMLSGFSLYINYSEENLCDLKQAKVFFIKRAIGILPMYYVAAILYILIISKGSIKETLFYLPIEALGLQSTFSSLFGYSHNGGTWFVSCIIICYLVYPYLQEIVKQMNMKAKLFLFAICGSILLYAPLVVLFSGIANIYSNPFFRLLEFLVGVLLASVRIELSENRIIKKLIFSWGGVLLEGIIYTICVTAAVKRNIQIGNYMFYSWIGLPLFSLMLLGMSGVESKVLEKSVILKYFSSLSYTFFLAQLYSNWLCKQIIANFEITSNLSKLFLGWGICVVIAVALHEIFEKRITKILKNKFLEK